jgi:hypothetical protein
MPVNYFDCHPSPPKLKKQHFKSLIGQCGQTKKHSNRERDLTPTAKGLRCDDNGTSFLRMYALLPAYLDLAGRDSYTISEFDFPGLHPKG